MSPVMNTATAAGSCSWIMLLHDISFTSMPISVLKIRKSQSAIHVQHRGCNTTVLSLLDKKWCTDNTGWAAPLLWHRNQAPAYHFSGNSHSKSSRRHHKMSVNRCGFTVCPFRKSLWSTLTYIFNQSAGTEITLSCLHQMYRLMKASSQKTVTLWNTAINPHFIMTFKRIWGSLSLFLNMLLYLIITQQRGHKYCSKQSEVLICCQHVACFNKIPI
jgi:hypothetical protein